MVLAALLLDAPPAFNAGSSAIARALAGDVAIAVQALATTILLAEDKQTQSRLFPEERRFVVRVPGGCFVEAGGNEPFRLARASGGRPAKDLHALLLSHPGEGNFVAERLQRSGATAEAERLLEPWVSTRRLPTRRQVGHLARYAVSVESLAYQVAARACMLVDEQAALRARARNGEIELRPIARNHWGLTTLQARMTLLSAQPDAAEWLVPMSRSFKWQTWTPSFSLVRERSLWGLMIAARSSAAFGGAVIDDYLAALARADRPSRVLDALIGLVAIACSDPDAAGGIERALLLRSGQSDAYGSAKAIQSAIHVVRAPDRATEQAERLLSWKLGDVFGLADRRTLLADGLTLLEDGQLLALLAVPTAVRAKVEDFFPKRSEQSRGAMWLSGSEMDALFTTQQDVAIGGRSHGSLH